MESKNVMVVLVVITAFGFFSNASALLNDKCYMECLAGCPKGAGDFDTIYNLPCASNCVKKCDDSPSPVDDKDGESTFYCTHGCAMEACKDTFKDSIKMKECLFNCANLICKKAN